MPLLTPSLKKGIIAIDQFCRQMPRGEENLPGVYRMINKNDQVVYVGKAKQLKKRLLSYTKPLKQSVRIQRMIAETDKVIAIITHTEAEALLLESNLIKELDPKYNILLKDDKSFPMILIRGDHPFPQILKHRGAKKTKGEYFGPYASTKAVNESLVILERIFRLRNCSDGIFAHRKRPCLQFHIKRCTAPCVGKVSENDYQRQVMAAKEFLKGHSRRVQEMLQKDMKIAADNRQYEKAGELRDRISALTQIQRQQTINIKNLNADIIALYRSGDKSAIEIFLYRDGQNHGNRSFFPKVQSDDADGDIMASFIGQFYQKNPPPKELLLSANADDQQTLERALSQIHQQPVSIITPKQGVKKQAVLEAIKNAKWSLEQREAMRTEVKQHLQNLAQLLEQYGYYPLKTNKLNRVEIYDNSHISGNHSVGAMVVYGKDGFDKKSYRLFNFASNQGRGGDDTKFMKEMLTRRLGRAINENAPLPDVIMLDGGKPQLSVGIHILTELGLTDKIAIMAVAKGPERNKGRERLFFPSSKGFSSVVEVALPLDAPLQFFIQRLRDEAHRFAIMAHRKKRKKDIESTSLDDIPGIGAKRKKALINHFGSAQLARSAGVADLIKVVGISKELAEHIYDHTH